MGGGGGMVKKIDLPALAKPHRKVTLPRGREGEGGGGRKVNPIWLLTSSTSSWLGDTAIEEQTAVL